MIKTIVAVSSNNVIGKDNDLLWHLPDDFKRFKELTTGHYIVMGRKTFESFPKPLPNRTHVIITRQAGYKKEGCIVVSSLEKAFQVIPDNEDTYIIGGGEIYKQSIDIIDVLEITRVHANFEGDTYFPEINEKDWLLVSEVYHPKDEKHAYDFTFQTFVKKNKIV